MIKHHDQGNLDKEGWFVWASGSRRMSQSRKKYNSSGRHGGRNRKLRAHIHNCKHETRVSRKWGQDHPKPTPSDSLPPARLRLLKVPQPPQTALSAGGRRRFLLKPPHVITFYTLSLWSIQYLKQNYSVYSFKI